MGIKEMNRVNRLLKFLNKYWLILSLCATIVSSLVTWGIHLKGRIDADEDTIKDTTDWVASHEDDIQKLHDKVVRLEALEEARGKICK
jgi:hypothetical protein